MDGTYNVKVRFIKDKKVKRILVIYGCLCVCGYHIVPLFYRSTKIIRSRRKSNLWSTMVNQVSMH